MIDTPETLPDLDMPTIIPETVANHLKTYVEMTHLKNNNIYEVIRLETEEKTCV